MNSECWSFDIYMGISSNRTLLWQDLSPGIKIFLWSWPSLECGIIGGIFVSQTHLVYYRYPLCDQLKHGSLLQFSCDVLQNSVQYRISTEDIRRKRENYLDLLWKLWCISEESIIASIQEILPERYMNPSRTKCNGTF